MATIRGRAPGFRTGIVTLWVSAVGLQAAAAPEPAWPQSEIRADGEPRSMSLSPGVRFEGHLAAGEVDVLRLELPAGAYLRLELEPRAIDSTVRFESPHGELLATTEGRVGRPSPSALAALTSVAGTHRLALKAVSSDGDGDGGDYALLLSELRPSGAGDAVRVEATRRLNQGFKLSEAGSAAASEEALEHFEAMLDAYRQLDDSRGRASAWYWIGLVLGDLDRHAESLEPYARALETWRRLKRRDQQAEVRYRIGIAERKIGRLAAARDALLGAADLWRQLGDRRGEALSHNNLSIVFKLRNQLQQALDHSRRARELFAEIGQASSEARELTNLASLHQLLGDFDRSLEHYEQALPILRQVGDRFSEAAILNNMGQIHRKRGQPRQALELYRRALAIAVEDDLTAARSVFLNNIGRARLDLDQPERALRVLDQALELSLRSGNPRHQAVRLISIGKALGALGDCPLAASRLEQALALSRRHGYRRQEAEVLYELARTHRRQGRLVEALLDVEAALAIVEGVRTDLDSHHLKASFFAYHSPYHELRVDLLMQRALARPGAGFDAAALAAHERGRARGLLETLAEAGTELRAAVPAQLLAEERRLHERLNDRALARSRLLADGPPAELAAVEAEIRDLLHGLDDAGGRIRDANPRFADLIRPRSLDPEDIRDRLLDADSVLLEIALGEERSFLWAVTPSTLEAFVLPSRRRIEAAARRVYELASDGEAWRGRDSWDQRLRYGRAAAELSRLVLAPAARRLTGSRLLVVADGALQYVPFAALPMPGSDRPLVLDHEVVSLPSASMLEVLRRERAARPPARDRLAILADPVYQSADPRLSPPPAVAAAVAAEAMAVERSAGEAGLTRFERLPHSRGEAEAIAALVGTDASYLAFGFDASRRLASRELGSFRWLHFATHGVFDSRTPELSGLVLSLFGRDGRPQDGFLRLHDVYNLNLNADLVVLSACHTALGKEIRGEGLIGLTRGFLHAGAQRVVASLWKVEDRATAQLMESFYRAMTAGGLRPAAALRRAQLDMIEGPNRRWRAPNVWAAFVFHGEWR